MHLTTPLCARCAGRKPGQTEKELLAPEEASASARAAACAHGSLRPEALQGRMRAPRTHEEASSLLRRACVVSCGGELLAAGRQARLSLSGIAQWVNVCAPYWPQSAVSMPPSGFLSLHQLCVLAWADALAYINAY
jgi:hypothetical protein